jgi:hypothetical protein
MRRIFTIATITLMAACKQEPAASKTVPATPSASPVAPAYAEDIRIMCDIPNDAYIQPILQGAHMDPSQRARVMAERVTQKITTDEARAFLKAMTRESVAPGQRETMLRAESSRVGLTTCAYADWWHPYATK